MEPLKGNKETGFTVTGQLQSSYQDLERPTLYCLWRFKETGDRKMARAHQCSFIYSPSLTYHPCAGMFEWKAKQEQPQSALEHSDRREARAPEGSPALKSLPYRYRPFTFHVCSYGKAKQEHPVLLGYAPIQTQRDTQAPGQSPKLPLISFLFLGL